MSGDFPSYHYLVPASKFIESIAVKILLDAELEPSEIAPEQDERWSRPGDTWIFRGYSRIHLTFDFPVGDASILRPVLDKPDRKFHLIMTRYFAYLVCYEGLVFEGCLAMHRKSQLMIV